MFLTHCGGSSSRLSLGKNREAVQNIDVCFDRLAKKKYKKAISCFESYKSQYYGQPESAIAQVALADTYFAKKDYLVAANLYEEFLSTFPYHERTPYVQYMAGMSYSKSAPKKIARDQENLFLALDHLQTVIETAPQSTEASTAKPLYNEVKTRIAQREFYIAKFYYRNREYLAAIPRFQTVITEYPQLGLDDITLYYLVSSLLKVEQKDLAHKYHDLLKQYFATSSWRKKADQLF